MNKKIALVTGGTRGIGETVVKRLVDRDYFVNFTYKNNAVLAQKLEEFCGGNAIGTQVDSLDYKSVDTYVHGICDRRKLDLLVNNAGIVSDALVENIDIRNAEKVIATNFLSLVNYSKSVGKLMRKNKYGDIINISSISADKITSGNSVYGSIKAAVNRFTLSMAFEYAKFNVAVNAISPGIIRTDLTKQFLSKNEKKILASIPLGRLTTLEEVADAVEILVARKPIFIGVCLPLGGGSQLNRRL